MKVLARTPPNWNLDSTGLSDLLPFSLSTTTFFTIVMSQTTAVPTAVPTLPITADVPTPAPMATSTVDSVAAPTTPSAPKPEPADVPSAASVTTTTQLEPTPMPIAPAALQSAAQPASIGEEPAVEAQNALTRKFTEAEWTALKDFRKALPRAVVDSYVGTDKTEAAPFNIWGVLIDPKHPAKDPRVSVVLMKFLRARHLSINSASSMLTQTLRWRETFGVDAAVKETFPDDVYGKVGRIHGKDKEGRPVVYNLYGANPDQVAVFGDVQRFLRWRVKLMESSLELLDFENVDQTVQIHDYQGASFTNRHPAAKQAASEATSLFADHYPELLYRKFFINVPMLLNWIFWVFKPMIAVETLAKMTVVGSGKSSISAALLPIIAKEELPSRYGGDSGAF